MIPKLISISDQGSKQIEVVTIFGRANKCSGESSIHLRHPSETNSWIQKTTIEYSTCHHDVQSNQEEPKRSKHCSKNDYDWWVINVWWHEMIKSIFI